MIIFLYPLEAM